MSKKFYPLPFLFCQYKILRLECKNAHQGGYESLFARKRISPLNLGDDSDANFPIHFGINITYQILITPLSVPQKKVLLVYTQTLLNFTEHR